jgi:hypothetical protein
MQALTSHVCQAASLDPQRLIVTFSHTHAAGLMGLEREPLPGGELIRPYLDELARRVASIVIQARSGAIPATLTYGRGRCDLAGHRDFWDEESRQFVCGFNPTGQADDTVLVVRATADEGQPIVTMVNYACHPTTLAWANTLISPDYPGAMRDVVEQATGAPCVFLQGASGELGPRDGYVGDTAVADRNGRQLGHAAMATFEALPPPGTQFQYAGPRVSGATLGTWEHRPLSAGQLDFNARWWQRRWTVRLPYRRGLPTREATLGERNDWQQREAAARAANDTARAAECRSMVERMDRRLVRLNGIAGEAFDLPIALWQIGSAVWVAVEGEPYSLLQRELRARFPETALVVCVLAGGARPSYLPPRELYESGIYQETIAVLAPGALETLIEAIAAQLDAWHDPRC